MVYIVTVVVLLSVAAVTIYMWQQSPKYDKISFKESLDLTDLPIVTFMHNNRKFNFLLDTGASRSILNARESKFCTYKNLEDANKLTGLDGIERTVGNILMEVSYKDNTYSEVFQVADMAVLCDDIKQETGVNVHGILGNAFFQKYKYVLDFNELVAYSKANK